MADMEDLFNSDEIKQIKSLKRKLNNIGKELDTLGLKLFGWSGSGCIIKHDDNAKGGAYVVQSLVNLSIDGGDPDYEELDDVY